MESKLKGLAESEAAGLPASKEMSSIITCPVDSPKTCSPKFILAKCPLTGPRSPMAISGVDKDVIAKTEPAAKATTAKAIALLTGASSTSLKSDWAASKKFEAEDFLPRRLVFVFIVLFWRRK